MSDSLKVAIYARVSTKDQNAENQIGDLERFCVAREWKVQKQFVDVGESGAKEDRPALRQLMELARQRKIDVVLVWKFDRFARSLRHLVSTLTEFSELGVNFVSLTESIDTTTAQGKMIFGILGAIAEFELSLFKERIRAGIRRRKARGERLGRVPLSQVKREALRRAFIELSQAQGRRASYFSVALKCGVAKSTAFRELREVEAVFRPLQKTGRVIDGEAIKN